jgi:5-methylcytosine-specific restriction enzyme subunit McrC
LLKSPAIQVFEYDFLQVGASYEGIVFTGEHFKQLAMYLTANKNCGYYSLLYNKVRFLNYVGVIKIGLLTIEILPKIEKADNDFGTWQTVLIDMLKISLQVEANTTTLANINLNQHSVLATYINIFLNETETLLHKGLIKKYRKEQGNKTALKGKLLFSKHISQNLIHAERFYVEYNDYNRDNIYNFILKATLECIIKIDASYYLTHKAKTLLDCMPECTAKPISESLFSKIVFDRKTEGYKTAIELARIILLNYHPDVKSGNNNILAIMFDMNLLWENYMYYKLRQAGNKIGVTVHGQQKRLFWNNDNTNQNLSLKPDLVISKGDTNIVIDTKWKYDSALSIQDVRQIYAYGDYFKANQNFLMYPDKITNATISVSGGKFYEIDSKKEFTNKTCHLMYVDIIKDKGLNKEIGTDILDAIFR